MDLKSNKTRYFGRLRYAWFACEEPRGRIGLICSPGSLLQAAVFEGAALTSMIERPGVLSAEISLQTVAKIIALGVGVSTGHCRVTNVTNAAIKRQQ